MQDFNYSDLSIVSWNIHGVFQQNAVFRYNKLQSPYFMDTIKNVQIFALLETHHTAAEIDQIQLIGCKCFNVCRKKMQFGRNSGGIAFYVKNNILQGVKKIGVDELCVGDFNARTSLKLDYLQSEDNTDIPVSSDIYKTDLISSLLRLNMDSKTNKYGDNVLSLCKSVPLRICNGLKLGDILGSFTCYTPNGQSCVDYCLASPRIFNSIKTFSVGYPILTMSLLLE